MLEVLRKKFIQSPNRALDDQNKTNLCVDCGGKSEQTSDAYPGVVPATGLVYEPTGELL